MRSSPFLAVGVATLIVGCSSITDPGEVPGPITTFQGAAAAGCATANPKTVLIDPTHDGGTWWFPQGASGFDPSMPHQGQAFADLLRARGYTVTELGRGATMSPDSMMKYAVIVRAGYYYDERHPGYSAADLAAYAAYASCGRTLIMLAEYLREGRRDDLAEHFGIPLTGIITDDIDTFSAHALTAGVTEIPYIAGSYLSSESNPSIEVLGRIDGRGVMGLLKGRAAKIFFIGDVNGIQLLPQPFVDNLISWGF